MEENVLADWYANDKVFVKEENLLAALNVLIKNEIRYFVLSYLGNSHWRIAKLY